MEDLLNAYIKESKRYVRLSPEEELVLFKTIAASTDPDKKDVEDEVMEIVKANLALVIDIVMKHRMYALNTNGKLALVDLIGVGNEVLIKAAQSFRYDNEKGFKFTTYACKSILNGIRRAFFDSKFIRIPEHYFAYKKEIDLLKEEYGDYLSDEIISERLKVTKKTVSVIRFAMGMDIITWDAFVKDHHNDASLMDVEVTVGMNELKAYLIDKVKSLPDMEKIAIVGVFFEDKTVGDLAKEKNVKHYVMSGHYKKALKNLKCQMKDDYSVDAKMINALFP